MNTFSLDTTQNIAIEYPLAGVGDRILATLLDFAIVVAYYFIILFVFGIYSSGFRSSNTFSVVLMFLLFSPLMFYNLAFEIWMNGQTLGKKVLHIRVMDMKGGSPTISQYFIRWLLRLVDIALDYGIVAFIAVIATEKSQRLGDLAAGTIVVKTNVKTGVETNIDQLQAISTIYEPQYPEVEHLDHSDIAVVKEVINTVNKTNNTMLALELANKLEQKLGVSRGTMEPMNFLYTILTDYQQTQ